MNEHSEGKLVVYCSSSFNSVSLRSNRKKKRYTKGYGKIRSFSDDQFNPDADKRANHSGSSRRGWRVCSAAHHKVAERPRVPACLLALVISRTWSPNLVHSNIFILL